MANRHSSRLNVKSMERQMIWMPRRCVPVTDCSSLAFLSIGINQRNNICICISYPVTTEHSIRIHQFVAHKVTITAYFLCLLHCILHCSIIVYHRGQYFHLASYI
uniref:Uncharacterized protein n=1 Tax=Opuntia streptacantha TaxID=393608 RepID=A0A7C9DEP8_OPUST